MNEADAQPRELLLRLIALHVEAAATGRLILAVDTESKRFLDQNPNAEMSLQDIRDEIARRAIQWGAVVEFGDSGGSS